MEGNQLIQEMVPDKYKHRKEKNNKTSTKIFHPYAFSSKGIDFIGIHIGDNH